jgi:hypothetical protein
MMFVVVFHERHIRWHSDFRVRVSEIDSHLRPALDSSNRRHRRETARCRADIDDGARPETITSSVSSLLETDSRAGFRIRINSAVQPELLAMQADYLLVNRKLIRSDRRDRLQICLVNPLVDRHVTPIDSQLIEKLTGIP